LKNFPGPAASIILGARCQHRLFLVEPLLPLLPATYFHEYARAMNAQSRPVFQRLGQIGNGMSGALA
jgi:hypothetical protein